MDTFWGVVRYLLYLYLAVVIARLVIDVTRMFARSWRPVGVTAVSVELVYASTDPPVKFLRKVVPPLRLGGVALDLSIYILILFLTVAFVLLSSYT